MQLTSLQQAGRKPTLPLSLELDGETLLVERWLRVLPGQRYVGQAVWREQKVLAKIFVGNRAKRQFDREYLGVNQLAQQNLATPELVGQNWSHEHGGWLLFQYLNEATTLGRLWDQVKDQPLLSLEQQEVLGKALECIAQMHSKGLWQSDLHLDNILVQHNQLWVVDGGGVEVAEAGHALPRELALNNLGVFFAQLPAEIDLFLEDLLIHYLLNNSAHALPVEALQSYITKFRRWRLKDFLKKIGRDCSLFSAQVNAFGLKVFLREKHAQLEPLLSDLDSHIDAGHIYKTGGAATVARIESAGVKLVIKRYNVKNIVHWLKRFWRPSRAWHSWREANRLQVLGISTPTPLAVVEKRWCGLRGRAYLVTDYCSEEDIIDRFQSYLHISPPESDLIALDRLFNALVREQISHGDLKGHNVFWDARRHNWSLIDLDAMRQHRSARSFARAYARDRARFLRNWPADCYLYQLLDKRLPQLP